MIKVLAMILAGGHGTRLSVLTQKRAKPAVPFAGKYRIIDFTLSNCVNSGIYDVGILTQYPPRSLNDHIRRGQPWDLDRRLGGVTLLQPYLGRREADWYRGTADAIYQNLDFINHYHPDVVLVLSGDHVYKMNYMALIGYHQEKQADLTISAIEVPLDEAHRFGILVTDEDRRVIRFQEKPTVPESNLASMGIYVFTTEVLLHRLEEDAHRRGSKHDFGRDILPHMVRQGDRVYAYPFSSYWVDVGTIQAFWEAHMDLLQDTPSLNLYDRSWVIHTRSEERPPVKVHREAVINNSLLSDGCIIEGTVEFSVLSPGVYVGSGATVRYSIVMTDAVIEEGATVDQAILDKNVVIGRQAYIGYGEDRSPNETDPALRSGITVVGKNTVLPPGIRVGRNCVIAADLPESTFQTDHIPSGRTIPPQ